MWRGLKTSIMCAVIFATFATPAFARLGGDTNSVLRYSVTTSHSVTSFQNYDIHEGRGATGLIIREYVDRSGRVFALTWQASQAPNLGELLGDYATQFDAAAAHVRPGSHHVLSVRSADLEAGLTRLPRGWAGRAVLTSGVPEGVTREEIR